MMFAGLRRRVRRREESTDDPAPLLPNADRKAKALPRPQHKYVVAEDNDDTAAADDEDAKSDGEELLNWAELDSVDLGTSFGLMSLKTGSGRVVDPPDVEKLQQAKVMLEAADSEVLGAQSLPVGSDWPVVSLVTPDGPSKHAMQPQRLAQGDLDVQTRDRSEFKRGRELEE